MAVKIDVGDDNPAAAPCGVAGEVVCGIFASLFCVVFLSAGQCAIGNGDSFVPHLALHELRAADHGVNVLVGTLPLPEFGFHHADGRFCRGTVDALAFHAVHEMAAEALLTVLVGVRIIQHLFPVQNAL